jgi:D-glycero-alpha-D-manno-heptose-7-phosphate kinase
MAKHVVEATAPTRVDLAGGTLDIWPLYLFHPGAVTLNAAIDRRAFCRVETGIEGVRLESRDTLRTVEAPDVAGARSAGGLPLVAAILEALDVHTGIHVVTQSRVPAGSGLGGSSALAVAIAAAVARAIGRELAADALWSLVRDAEARCIGVPTGIQDYLAAIHGGVLAVRLRPGAPIVERLPCDPARVEESLLLVNTGEARFSGINNWEVFKGQIDGRAGVPESLAAIAAASARLAEALSAQRYEAAAELIAAEWEARKRLAPAVATAEIDRIADVARGAGGAAKVCGAGGGGVVAVWAAPGARGPGARERVAEALRSAGFTPMPFRLDLRGLEVEERSGL